jgi:hypothetical protein
LFVEQSLAERAQAQTGLLWEEANAHAEAAAAREGKLQAEVAVACEIQCVKEAMARQAHKDATDLKNKLEDAEQKAKDAASDLQAVVEGKSLIIAQELTPCACVCEGPIRRPERGGVNGSRQKFFSREIETPTRRTSSVEPPKSHAPHFYLPFAKTT